LSKKSNIENEKEASNKELKCALIKSILDHKKYIDENVAFKKKVEP